MRAIRSALSTPRCGGGSPGTWSRDRVGSAQAAAVLLGAFPGKQVAHPRECCLRLAVQGSASTPAAATADMVVTIRGYRAYSLRCRASSVRPVQVRRRRGKRPLCTSATGGRDGKAKRCSAALRPRPAAPRGVARGRDRLWTYGRWRLVHRLVGSSGRELMIEHGSRSSWPRPHLDGRREFRPAIDARKICGYTAGARPRRRCRIVVVGAGCWRRVLACARAVQWASSDPSQQDRGRLPEVGPTVGEVTNPREAGPEGRCSRSGGRLSRSNRGRPLPTERQQLDRGAGGPRVGEEATGPGG